MLPTSISSFSREERKTEYRQHGQMVGDTDCIRLEPDSPPLFVDCCPVSKNGKTTWNPPLSTWIPTRKRKGRTGYNPQKVKNVASVCVSIYISNIPRLLGAFLFHRRYQEQFTTFLCASLSEVVPTHHSANNQLGTALANCKSKPSAVECSTQNEWKRNAVV